MGTSGEDHREGNQVRRTPTGRSPRTSPRRRPASPVEPVIIPEPAPYVPSPEFAAAYAAPHNEVGPILTRWEGNRAVWLLPTNSPAEFRHRYPKGRA
jgi:hypothetical protein